MRSMPSPLPSDLKLLSPDLRIPSHPPSDLRISTCSRMSIRIFGRRQPRGFGPAGRHRAGHGVRLVRMAPIRRHPSFLR